MHPKSLEMLEFPKVREILAGFTDFSASEELAQSLAPSTDAAEVKWLLETCAENPSRRGAVPPGDACSARFRARRAAVGGMPPGNAARQSGMSALMRNQMRPQRRHGEHYAAYHRVP